MKSPARNACGGFFRPIEGSAQGVRHAPRTMSVQKYRHLPSESDPIRLQVLFYCLHMRRLVDVVRPVLGIHNGLARVHSEISGDDIGQGDADEVVGPAVHAEEFEADEEGRDGAVRDAAEEGADSDRRAKGRREADERGKGCAEGGSDIEGGYNLAALIGAGNGNGREEDLQKKVVAVDSALHGLRDDLDAGPVIPLVRKSGQEGEKEKEQASDQGLGVAGGKELFFHGGGRVQSQDEEDGNKAGDSRQQGSLRNSQYGSGRNLLRYIEERCRRPQPARCRSRHHRRQDAGHQGRIVHDPDRYDFHGKEGSRYRGSEEGREDGRHPAHGDGVPVILVEFEKLAHVLPQGTTDLQGRPLPADRGTREVGEDRGEKY